MLTSEQDRNADALVDQIMSVDPHNQNETARRDAGMGMKSFGAAAINGAAAQSRMLRSSIGEMSRDENGKKVAEALLSLQKTAENLDIKRVNLRPGLIRRTLSKIPFIGTPLGNYIGRMQSAQKVIDGITRTLEDGRDELLKDNESHEADRAKMRGAMIRLAQAYEYARAVDAKLEARIAAGGLDEEHVRFLREEILLPLRQSTLDLKTQYTVALQTVQALDLMIKNNDQLARNVNRTVAVVGPALGTGAITAIGLARQGRVLAGTKAAKKVAEDVITNNSIMLKDQGGEIYRSASEAAIDPDVLAAAQQRLTEAIEAASTWKAQALVTMKDQIKKLERVAREGEKALRRAENGRKPRAEILAQIDPARALTGPGSNVASEETAR